MRSEEHAYPIKKDESSERVRLLHHAEGDAIGTACASYEEVREQSCSRCSGETWRIEGGKARAKSLCAKESPERAAVIG